MDAAALPGGAGRKAEMYTTQQDRSTYRVSYRSYLLGFLLLAIPPALLYEYSSSLLEGSLDKGEMAGLGFGLLLPLLGAWFLIESASFSFLRDEGVFRWRRRDLWRREAGEVALQRIARVGRQSMDSSDAAGVSHIYRLIVELDDGRVIPLTRSFSGLYDRRLERIAAQIREHLGHVVALR